MIDGNHKIQCRINYEFLLVIDVPCKTKIFCLPVKELMDKSLLLLLLSWFMSVLGLEKYARAALQTPTFEADGWERLDVGFRMDLVQFGAVVGAGTSWASEAAVGTFVDIRGTGAGLGSELSESESHLVQVPSIVSVS